MCLKSRHTRPGVHTAGPPEFGTVVAGWVNVASVTTFKNSPRRGPLTSADSPSLSATRATRLERLRSARLYLCCDLQKFLATAPGQDSVERLDADRLELFFRSAFRGGVDIIQVRDKKVSIRTELEALRLLVRVAGQEGGLSAANDRADAALLARVDVFHVGQTDLTTHQARAVLGDDVLLGRSCHTRSQVLAASEDPGTDYYCTGPVWETPTKPGRPAVGLDLPAFAADLDPVCDTSSTPFFAIGGIDEETVSQVKAAGAGRIVVVRAIADAPAPENAARRLADALGAE
jgi:thiamine-phosphate pyrophosphorylase